MKFIITVYSRLIAQYTIPATELNIQITQIGNESNVAFLFFIFCTISGIYPNIISADDTYINQSYMFYVLFVFISCIT